MAAASEIKLFNKWSFQDVRVEDLALNDYIAVKPDLYSVYLPHTAGRFNAKRFRKAQCPIVERLVCSLMMHGRNNGKKLMAVRIVKHCFEIIHLLTDQNPIQVLVEAVINSGPREDSTRIGSAGTVRRQAVDVSPMRRVNVALYLLCTGAREAAFRSIKTIAECLADELINAAKGSSNSYAIKKKDELLYVHGSDSSACSSAGRLNRRACHQDLVIKAELVPPMSTNQSFSLNPRFNAFGKRSDNATMHSKPFLAISESSKNLHERKDLTSIAFSMGISPQQRSTRIDAANVQKENRLTFAPKNSNQGSFSKTPPRSPRFESTGQRSPSSRNRFRPTTSWSGRKCLLATQLGPQQGFRNFGVAPNNASVKGPSEAEKLLARRRSAFSSSQRKRSNGFSAANEKRIHSVGDVEARRETDPERGCERSVPEATSGGSTDSGHGENNTVSIADDIRRKVQGKLQGLEEILDIVAEPLARLEANETQLEKNFQVATKRSLSLSNQLEVVRREKNAGLKEISELQQELIDLEARYNDCRQEYADQQNHVRDLESKVQESETESEILKKEITQANETLVKRGKVQDELEKNLKNANEELRYLQEQLGKQAEVQKELTSTKEKLEEEVKRMEHSSVSKNATFEERKRELQKLIAELQERNSDLNKVLNEQQVECQKNKTYITTLESKEQQCQGLLNVEKVRNKQASEQLQEAQTALLTEKSKRESTLKELEELRKTEQRMHQTHSAELTKTSENVSKLELELSNKEHELNARTRRCASLESELGNLTKEAGEIRRQNDDLSVRIGQSERDLRSVNDRCAGIVNELRREKENLKVLSKELEEQKLVSSKVKKEDQEKSVTIGFLQSEVLRYKEVEKACAESLRRAKQSEEEVVRLQNKIRSLEKMATGEVGSLKGADKINISPAPLNSKVDLCHPGTDQQEGRKTWSRVLRNFEANAATKPATKQDMMKKGISEVENNARRPLRPRNGPITKLRRSSRAKARNRCQSSRQTADTPDITDREDDEVYELWMTDNKTFG